MCDSNGAKIQCPGTIFQCTAKLSNHNANEEASTEKQTCLWLKLLVGILYNESMLMLLSTRRHLSQTIIHDDMLTSRIKTMIGDIHSSRPLCWTILPSTTEYALCYPLSEAHKKNTQLQCVTFEWAHTAIQTKLNLSKSLGQHTKEE